MIKKTWAYGKVGDEGTIVFERGGPTGGHWQYYHKK